MRERSTWDLPFSIESKQRSLVPTRSSEPTSEACQCVVYWLGQWCLSLDFSPGLPKEQTDTAREYACNEKKNVWITRNARNKCSVSSHKQAELRTVRYEIDPIERFFRTCFPLFTSWQSNLPSLNVSSIFSTSMPMVADVDRNIANMIAFLGDPSYALTPRHSSTSVIFSEISRKCFFDAIQKRISEM